jgi:hypothetical protein
MGPADVVTRRHVRIAAPVRVYDLDAMPPEALSTKNVSLGGFFLLTRRRRAVGSTMELAIEHREQKATVHGRVTHLQADGIGIAFVDATDAFLQFVQTIIDDLLAGGARVDDRRSASRSFVTLQVVWRQEGIEYQGRLRNLSAGGALIECENCPDMQSEIFVYLPGYTYALSSPRPSEARGCAARVLHRVSYGFGVQFLAPSAEFRMAIEALLREARAGK